VDNPKTELEFVAVTYRWLEPSELPRIDSVFAKRGWIRLSEHFSRVRVAEVDGKIVGFFCFQGLPYMGPMNIEESQRGKGIAEDLVSQMLAWTDENNCRGYMVVADSPHTEKLCKAKGLTRVVSPVYIQLKDINYLQEESEV